MKTKELIRQLINYKKIEIIEFSFFFLVMASFGLITAILSKGFNRVFSIFFFLVNYAIIRGIIRDIKNIKELQKQKYSLESGGKDMK